MTSDTKPKAARELNEMKFQKLQYKPGDKLPDGTLYVGIMNDSGKVYHLSIEPQDEPKQMTWHEASKLKQCPTIREISLMSANAAALGLIKDEFYWSSTEYSNGNSFAYSQRFSDGYLFNNVKNNTFWVRCVRRYSITQSFDHLKPEIAELKARVAALEEKFGGGE